MTLKGINRWSAMNPENVANITVKKMLAGNEVIIPGFWNQLFILMDKLLPKWFKEWLTDRQLKTTFADPTIPTFQYLRKVV
jgi:short-subunit dehydrogenase